MVTDNTLYPLFDCWQLIVNLGGKKKRRVAERVLSGDSPGVKWETEKSGRGGGHHRRCGGCSIRPSSE